MKDLKLTNQTYRTIKAVVVQFHPVYKLWLRKMSHWEPVELEPTLQFATDHRHERKEKRRNKKLPPTFCRTVANRIIIMIIGNSRQLQIEMHCHGVETFSAFNSFSTQGRPRIWFGNRTIPLVKCFLFYQTWNWLLKKMEGYDCFFQMSSSSSTVWAWWLSL